jgi:hypothetical protein
MIRTIEEHILSVNWEEIMNWTREVAAGVGLLVFVISSFLLVGQLAA